MDRRNRRSSLLACLFVAAISLAGSGASAAMSPDEYGPPRDLAGADPDGRWLAPGEFTWLAGAEENSDAPVTLLVSLRDQRAFVYREGRRIAVTTVSTGRPGYDTPQGVFPIMGKKKTHYSNRYDDAPMPWMQRLTNWGHALHAGTVRSTPASHGCVRLPPEFAEQLYALTRPGDLVVISQDVTPRSLAIALAIGRADSRVAHRVGVTAPLPPIVLVPYREPVREERATQVSLADAAAP